jgi:amino acid adenylation domain-containing protein
MSHETHDASRTTPPRVTDLPPGVQSRAPAETGGHGASPWPLLDRIPSSPEASCESLFDDVALRQSIPERFEQQVHAQGDRVAIRWSTGGVDYGDLNATANRLAHAILARRSRSTGGPIALLFDHGGDVIAAMLAVLKAAACYVVLDPRYPGERLTYMLDDSAASIVVASGSHLELARALAGDRVEVIPFDSADTRYSDRNPGAYARPDDLAMLIYTSGSTGQPKAVMHSHQNVLADVRNYTRGWSITPADRWLLATSMGFAHSVRSIYGALLNGAGLFPFDPRSGSFTALAEWLLEHRITVVRILPTFFRQFTASLTADALFSSVRVLSLGGEPMLPTDLAAFNRHFAPTCVLTHAFGPTECLTVCWALVPHGTQVRTGRIPIGRPLPYKEVTLVDEARRGVPDGEVGEIAVTSPYLALGYWRAPELTARAFQEDPTGRAGRTYFTGDLARRDSDGVLWHVGRRDFQVKVRGFRVDVSEVEHALRGMPGIGDVVVVGQQDDRGEQRLVAYFVPTSTPAVAGRTLRDALARSLPDHMRPSTFVALEALPLTPHGKVDRLRLPRPPAGSDAREGMVEPRTPIEADLVRLVAEVLGLDAVNLGHCWLDLGGDSLQATRVETALAARLDVTLPPGTVLRARTLRDVANTVAGLVGERSARSPEGGPPSEVERGC